MVELDQLTKGLQLDFEPRAIFIVEIAELNKGVQGLASSWEGPISNHIELGLRRAVAFARQIMAHVFNTFLKKITLAQFQRQTILLANKENAFEVIKELG